MRLPGFKRKPDRQRQTADGSLVVSLTGEPPLVKSLGTARLTVGEDDPSEPPADGDARAARRRPSADAEG